MTQEENEIYWWCSNESLQDSVISLIFPMIHLRCLFHLLHTLLFQMNFIWTYQWSGKCFHGF